MCDRASAVCLSTGAELACVPGGQPGIASVMKLPPAREPGDPRSSRVRLRRDLVEAGWSDVLLAQAVRNGVLARPRRGAYVDAAAWRSLDEAGRHALRARAAVQQAKTRVVLSHVSGLVEVEAPLWGLDLEDVHLTRLDGKIGRHEAGIHQHCGAVAPDDVVRLHGVELMNPARLAVEATTYGSEIGLVVTNDLLHRALTTREEIRERYSLMTAWPHTLSTDVVIRLADARIESVGESRTLWMCHQQGLPMPVPQHEVRDASGRLVGRVDFAWPELGVYLEFDGRVKYEKLLKEGERASDVVFREKRREDEIRRVTGWRCLRIAWSDLENPARLAAMIRAFLFPAA